MKLGEWLWEEMRRNGGRAAGSALGLVAVVGVGASFLRWKTLRDRELRRPFAIRDLAAGEEVSDPQGELTRIVEWLQDTIVCPLDARLPGCPFQHDLLAFPFTPMVLVIGNHSAGKSTFINRMLGVQVQETGVAPTDDGFTVLQRHATSNEVEDGPTLLSCPENRPFKELQRFGQPFWGHFRRKRLVLPQSSPMPMGLQIVDTPGMIDMPVKMGTEMAGGRGYNFLEVVRWFAKRADLILLLFREKFLGPRWVPSSFWLAYSAVCYGAARFLREYTKQFERLQIADLDTYFEEAYGWHFIHADSEDLRGRWTTARPRVVNILRAASSIVALPSIAGWEITRINTCLEKDIWYLRLLAKLLRGGAEAMSPA
mmetsp:Transcript_61863/g.124010  ORF Transcript_61863/g.124010 Transcript_61863/m.124010 type:complete len:370 (+) Transcript_61863:1-1110(+)